MNSVLSRSFVCHVLKDMVLLMHVHLCMYVCHMCAGACGSKKGALDSPEAGVTGTYTLLKEIAENWTQALCVNSGYY